MELKKTSITGRLDKNILLFLPTLILAIAFSGCGGEMDSGSSDNPADPAPAVPRPANQCFNAGGNSGHSAILNSQGNAYPVDTGMLAMNGDKFTIQPTSVVHEESSPLPPVVTRIENEVCVQNVDVCVGTVPVIQHQCHNSCKLCTRCLIDFIGLGCAVATCCEQQCQDVHTGDTCVAWDTKCVKQQSQWTETSLFSGLSSSKRAEDRSPMKSPKLVEALLSGLNIRFSSSDDAGNTKSVDCPLSAFKPTIAAEKVTFQVGDVVGCPSIFADHPERPSPDFSQIKLLAS